MPGAHLRRGLLRRSSGCWVPVGGKQATLPWPGYLNTGLGWKIKPLPQVNDNLAMALLPVPNGSHNVKKKSQFHWK